MHFKGHEEFVARVLDLQGKAKRYRKVIFTPFLNEFEQDIVQKVSKEYFVSYEGGYANAERKMAAIAYYEEDMLFPIVCLKATYNTKYASISHRDVLGSLLHSGIERNVIGDIVVKENCIYVFVNEEMAFFIKGECRSIKRCQIVWEDTNEEVEEHKQIEWEEKIISSFRLDVIVAAICKVNREKAKLFITGGIVKVNQVILEDCTYLCHNNNAISIRGYGRFAIEKENRLTKKNRHVIRIGKYI